MSLSSKKIWQLVGVILALLLFLFIALPLQSNVHDQVKFKSNVNALNRQLLRDTSWHNWWPGKVEITGKEIILHHDEFTFKKGKVYLNKIEFEISSNSISMPALFTIMAEADGNVLLSFHSILDLEHNPINRVKTLLQSSKLKSTFRAILENQSKYFSSTKHLYDVDIKESTVQFEFYATLTRNFTYEPSVTEQYAMLDEVKKFIKENNATEKGYPMLNITKTGDREFFTQIAIPTDVQLPSMNGIKTKWMLKGGHILRAEVRGGKNAISNAKEQMQNYINDNNKTLIAIPFESLISNRLEQPDSSKWITDIYFPVLY